MKSLPKAENKAMNLLHRTSQAVALRISHKTISPRA